MSTNTLPLSPSLDAHQGTNAMVSVQPWELVYTYKERERERHCLGNTTLRTSSTKYVPSLSFLKL